MTRKQVAPAIGSTKKVEIAKGSIKISCTRADVLSIDSSHDGIVFQMSNGMVIHVADQFMPNEAKERIKVGLSGFPNSDIKINLNRDRYKSPLMCDLGKAKVPDKKEESK